MPDSQILGNEQHKVYVVRFKSPGLQSKTFVAASVAMHGDHLVLLDPEGKLVAMFLMDAVESCNEM
jgi:hypothetical protein